MTPRSRYVFEPRPGTPRPLPQAPRKSLNSALKAPVPIPYNLSFPESPPSLPLEPRARPKLSRLHPRDPKPFTCQVFTGPSWSHRQIPHYPRASPPARARPPVSPRLHASFCHNPQTPPSDPRQPRARRPLTPQAPPRARGSPPPPGCVPTLPGRGRRADAGCPLRAPQPRAHQAGPGAKPSRRPRPRVSLAPRFRRRHLPRDQRVARAARPLPGGFWDGGDSAPLPVYLHMGLYSVPAAT